MKRTHRFQPLHKPTSSLRLQVSKGFCCSSWTASSVPLTVGFMTIFANGGFCQFVSRSSHGRPCPEPLTGGRQRCFFLGISTDTSLHGLPNEAQLGNAPASPVQRVTGSCGCSQGPTGGSPGQRAVPTAPFLSNSIKLYCFNVLFLLAVEGKDCATCERERLTQCGLLVRASISQALPLLLMLLAAGAMRRVVNAGRC